MSALDDLLGGGDAPLATSNTYRWGTVTGVDPLRVRLDGDMDAVGSTPVALCLTPLGARVWVQLYGRQLVILGAAQEATTWREITPANGWTVSGELSVGRSAGIAYLRGAVRRTAGGITSGTYETAFIIPEGFRTPKAFRINSAAFGTTAALKVATVDFGTTGIVGIAAGPGPASTSTSDIHYFMASWPLT